MNLTANAERLFGRLLLVIVSIAPLGSAFCQGEPASSELDVKATAILQKHEHSEDRFAEVDLGELPVGTKTRMLIKIVNNEDKDFEFASAMTACNCSEFRSDGFVVPAMGELNASFRMKTPKRRDDPRAVAGIILLNDEKKPMIRVRFRYQLAGLLSFEHRLGVVRFAADEKIKTVDLPFHVTPPLSINDVQVKGGESFSDLVFEKIPTEKGGIVRATIASNFIEAGGVSGEVSIVHPKTGLKDTHRLTVKHNRDVEINPQVIRFRNTKKGFVGNAIVRIPKLNATSDDPANKSGTPEKKSERKDVDSSKLKRRFSVACYLNKEKVECRVKKLSNEIYRIRLHIPEKKMDDDSDQEREGSDPDGNALIWRIVYDDLSTNLMTEFAFEK